MGLSQEIRSYEDIRQLLDEALGSERGVAISYSTRGKALHQRQRMYKFRSLDRLASVDIFPVGDSRRGVSAYDALEFEYEEFADGTHWLKIIPAAPREIVRL